MKDIENVVALACFAAEQLEHSWLSHQKLTNEHVFSVFQKTGRISLTFKQNDQLPFNPANMRIQTVQYLIDFLLKNTLSDNQTFAVLSIVKRAQMNKLWSSGAAKTAVQQTGNYAKAIDKMVFSEQYNNPPKQKNEFHQWDKNWKNIFEGFEQKIGKKMDQLTYGKIHAETENIEKILDCIFSSPLSVGVKSLLLNSWEWREQTQNDLIKCNSVFHLKKYLQGLNTMFEENVQRVSFVSTAVFKEDFLSLSTQLNSLCERDKNQFEAFASTMTLHCSQLAIMSPTYNKGGFLNVWNREWQSLITNVLQGEKVSLEDVHSNIVKETSFWFNQWVGNRIGVSDNQKSVAKPVFEKCLNEYVKNVRNDMIFNNTSLVEPIPVRINKI